MRIEEPAVRAQVLRDFYDEFDRLVEIMCDGSAAIFGRADEANRRTS